MPSALPHHFPSEAGSRRPPAALPILLLALLLAVIPDRIRGEQSGRDDWDEWDAGQPTAATPAAAPTATPSFHAAPLPAETSRKVQALKEKGNASYRAKRYADACRHYRQASLLDGNDAGLMNDLGACLRNLGRKDSALSCTREALRLADRSLASESDYDWSFPDLRARKTAYFNLDRVGGPMKPPRPGQCETWSAPSACGGRYHVCAEEGNRPAGEGLLRWSVLRVGLTRSRALFSRDETDPPSQVPRPEMRDMEQISIEGMSESRSRWLNRDSSVVVPLGDVLETADPACAGICGRLERVQSECRILHFDPCAGVVGVACGIMEGEGGDRIVMGEFYLIPAR